MNVGELRAILAKLPDALPVRVEVSFDDGDSHEGADLEMADVECRCDEVDALYLFGDQDEPQGPRGCPACGAPDCAVHDEDESAAGWADKAGA